MQHAQLLPDPADSRHVYGDVTEDNDRIYSIEPTPAFATHRPPVTLRMWGNGHWVRCDGQAHHYATEDDAHAAGRRWLTEGMAR